jgi:HD superfamily phosphohydrolase
MLGNYLNCDNKNDMYDDTHKTIIKISNLAKIIIDNEKFTRMRDIKQLGVQSFNNNNANHTRYVHSIGTYYLTGVMLNVIKQSLSKTNQHLYLSQIPELEEYYKNKKYCHLDNYICEIVKIAGLCHDLGHGPFSHVFDDILKKIPKYKDNINAEHETRSCLIFENIVKNDKRLNFIISDNMITFVKNVINPTIKNKGFLYQIVNNQINSLDTDKFDYLPRDSKYLGEDTINVKKLIESVKVLKDQHTDELNINYDLNNVNLILDIFYKRFYLHKKYYNDPIVISYQEMMNYYLKKIDPIINLFDSINDMNIFCDNTDESLINIPKIYNKIIQTSSHNNLKNANYILKRFNNVEPYKIIIKKNIPSKNQLNKYLHLFKKSSIPDRFNKSEIIIYNKQIGTIHSATNNPLKYIYVYDEHYQSTTLNDDNLLTNIIPSLVEYSFVIFYKNKNEKKIKDFTKYCNSKLS